MRIRTSPEHGFNAPLFSIVMVTYARDHLVPETIAQAAKVAASRLDEVEFVLVDNNADETDRSSFLSPFVRWQYVKLGYNKGVSARNDGANAARGSYMVFVDDDAFLNPEGVLDRYEALLRRVTHRDRVEPELVANARDLRGLEAGADQHRP